MKLKAIFGGIFGLAIVIVLAAACFWVIGKMRETTDKTQKITDQTKPQDNSFQQSNDEFAKIHLALGNPSNASLNPTNDDNYLLISKYSAVSYNRSKNLANWVAWRLTKADFGDISRQNDFRPDDRLPNGWTRIATFDYSGSGFDRGHLCPSGDRSSSIDANSSTFVMTNITPQTNDLNTGPWEKFESFTRGLVFKNNTVYVITGHYGDRGKVRRKITIPTNFWKIVVAVPNKSNISAINAETKVIAVDMPNINGIGEQDWHGYKTSVREIEQKTGYNFLSNIPQNVQDQIETTVYAN